MSTQNDIVSSRLSSIQKNLKAPKGQLNKFGGYHYRSCEDILEAVKPLLGDAQLTLSDEMVAVGDRYYVKAVATLAVMSQEISVSAFAREAETKKGMDEAQITGAASSYARKYALNGLFAIDDTKDADATNTHDKSPPESKTSTPKTYANSITKDQAKELMAVIERCGWTVDDAKAFLLEYGGWKSSLEIPKKQYQPVVDAIEANKKGA
jgi:hypothetical protein